MQRGKAGIELPPFCLEHDRSTPQPQPPSLALANAFQSMSNILPQLCLHYRATSFGDSSVKLKWSEGQLKDELRAMAEKELPKERSFIFGSGRIHGTLLKECGNMWPRPPPNVVWCDRN
ncbi:unnamed protein product [Pleuronectes platessa]|uniref:Uncharacterized protein n=1 Tax=Pleuronectes platessa TaxID=8262 RepID=A0A9N7YPW4_PLEPL|nr:unnamed protein product [Pleuronectes platessa]